MAGRQAIPALSGRNLRGSATCYSDFQALNSTELTRRCSQAVTGRYDAHAFGRIQSVSNSATGRLSIMRLLPSCLLLAVVASALAGCGHRWGRDIVALSWAGDRVVAACGLLDRYHARAAPADSPGAAPALSHACRAEQGAQAVGQCRQVLEAVRERPGEK